MNTMKNSKKNYTWETNHDLLKQKFTELMSKNGKIPTQTELAEATGMSRNAVSRHLQEFDSSKLAGGNVKKFLFDVVEQKLLKNVTEFGCVKSAQLLWEIWFKTTQSTKIDLTTKGEKFQPQKSGDTFNILVPEWQQEVEALRQDLESNNQAETK